MPPKKGAKDKPKAGKAAAAAMATAAAAAASKPKKKPPPPPACFNADDLARFKELFKAHDEEGIDKVSMGDETIPEDYYFNRLQCKIIPLL